MNEQKRNEMDVSRADMHVHSTASELSKLGVQRSLALPECATEPAEVYELAKRRGMDFVTITDHDTIDGALTLAHLPDTFVSEELTVCVQGRAAGGPRALLRDHARRSRVAAGPQRRRRGVRRVPARATGLTAALAHPFYAVAAPLLPRHRRRLAQLFPIWETRNGSRAKELNLPAFVYIETHGGTAIGGSDDHAGIDIGAHLHRDAAAPRRPSEFLAHDPRRQRRRPRRPGQRREVDARRDGARDPRARRRATPTAGPTRPRC